MTISKNVWKAAALLLILCLVSTVMISGTYAKYTSTYAGHDTALVAKWEVTGTGNGLNTSTATPTLDLFSHLYNVNIVTAAGIHYIAPGVAGEFTLQFQNKSDVAAEINFEFAKTVDSAEVPIKYSLNPNGSDPKTLNDLASALSDNYFNSIPAGTTSAAVKVYWSWPYDLNDSDLDEADTELGAAPLVDRDYILNVTATAIQLTPTSSAIE